MKYVSYVSFPASLFLDLFSSKPNVCAIFANEESEIYILSFLEIEDF